MHLTPDAMSAYVDGELDVAARKSARLHLDDCAACRQEMARVEKLSALFTAGALEPGAEFEDRVLAKLRSMPLPRQSWWSRLQGSPLRMPALSAAALVLIGWGVYSVRQIQMKSGAEEVAAAASASAVEEISVADQADFLENVEMLEELDALEALDDGVPG